MTRSRIEDSEADRRTRVRALSVPLDATQPCRLIAVPRDVTSLGLAIRGGPLDLALSDSIGYQGFAWCADRRRMSTRAENSRAVALAARLNVIDVVDRIGLRGNVIVTGSMSRGELGPVPQMVLEAAYRTRLLDEVTALAAPSVRAESALDEVDALPRRTPSSLVGPPVFEWEDPQIMARVLAGLRDERRPDGTGQHVSGQHVSGQAGIGATAASPSRSGWDRRPAPAFGAFPAGGFGVRADLAVSRADRPRRRHR
jgi:hypothetical protein